MLYRSERARLIFGLRRRPFSGEAALGQQRLEEAIKGIGRAPVDHPKGVVVTNLLGREAKIMRQEPIVDRVPRVHFAEPALLQRPRDALSDLAAWYSPRVGPFLLLLGANEREVIFEICNRDAFPQLERALGVEGARVRPHRRVLLVVGREHLVNAPTHVDEELFGHATGERHPPIQMPTDELFISGRVINQF